MTFSWLFPFSTSFSIHNFGFFVCQISCHHIYCALHLQRRAVMYPRWAATPSDQVQTYFVPDVPLFKIGNPLAWPQRSHLWLSRTFHDPSPNFKTSFFATLSTSLERTTFRSASSIILGQLKSPCIPSFLCLSP